MTERKKVHISFNDSSEVGAYLDKKAEETSLSKSDVVRQILRARMASDAVEERKINDGI